MEFYLVTSVTHNTRISRRMEKYIPREILKTKSRVILNCKAQIHLAGFIAAAILKYDMNTFTYNVLPDHMHLVVQVCSENDLNERIGKLKGFTSFEMRRNAIIRNHLWAEKFNRKWIDNGDQLSNAFMYVENNHLKHEQKWGRSMLCGFDESFKKIRRSVCKNLEDVIDY